jgi:predicted GTPase
VSYPYYEEDVMLRSPLSSKDRDANSEISILVMGSTGAGKSSFIAKVTGAPVIIGDTIEPCKTVLQMADVNELTRFRYGEM